MRYTDTYKLFESRYTEFKSIIYTLEDYSLEIKDMGLRVSINPNNDIDIKVKSFNLPTSNAIPFTFTIHKGERSFEVKDILDTIQSICDYMIENEYDINIKLRNVCYMDYTLKSPNILLNFGYKHFNQNMHLVSSVISIELSFTKPTRTFY